MVSPVLHKIVISPIAVEEKNVIIVEAGILGFTHDPT
jgi:flagellar assembly factor FliW